MVVEGQNRAKFFDEDGAYVPSAHMTIDGKPWSLEASSDTQREMRGHFRSEKRIFRIPEHEKKLLADLLRKLCVYDVSKRPSVREALQHEWFDI